MHSVPGKPTVMHVEVTVPGGVPESVQVEIRKVIQRLGDLLLSRASVPFTGPGDLTAWEQGLHAEVPRECVDPVTAEMIRTAVENPLVLAQAGTLVASRPEMRLQAPRQEVKLDLLGGGTARLRVAYYLDRPAAGRRGARRRKATRGKPGNGFYPALAVLGIHERLTPAYASLVVREVIRGSLDEAQVSLSQRGVKRDRKALRRVVRIVSQRALSHQAKQAQGEERPAAGKWDLRGKKLGICVDGGKVRTRVNKPGRRRKSGRKSYRAEWREPRVIVVYELDDRGRKRRGGLVRYDATIADADETFERLASILRELGAVEAAQWAIAGDGADWIWNRVAWLIEKLGYSAEKVFEIVDFYHAVSYVNDFASLQNGWTDEERRRWVWRMRQWLKKGEPLMVSTQMAPLCKGPHAKQLRTIAERFVNNRTRMRYDQYRSLHLPCGSGVVESGVRRIINLRVKGAGIFWTQEVVEGLIHLRARYLSGDWDAYMLEIFAPRAQTTEDVTTRAELQAA